MQRFVSTRIATAVLTGAVLSLGAVSAQAVQTGNYQSHRVPDPANYSNSRDDAQSSQSSHADRARYATQDDLQPGNYQSHRVPDPAKYTDTPEDVRNANPAKAGHKRYASDYNESAPRSAAPNN